MTRKTSKKPAPSPRPHKRRFKLTVEGQPMLADYIADWMEGIGQFEFHSPHKPARRILVSETGYRSHFADMAAAEAEESPQEYARLVALAFIRRDRPEKIRAADKAQPTLFSLLD
jgi:hypothetical protein